MWQFLMIVFVIEVDVICSYEALKYYRKYYILHFI